MPPPNKQILLIDDQKALREVLKENLEVDGYVVWIAKNGEEAISMLRLGCRPDVVVSDISMPKGTGLDVLREVRDIDPNIKFVAMTGDLQKAEQQLEAASIGADAVLAKPFEIGELENVICSLVHF